MMRSFYLAIALFLYTQSPSSEASDVTTSSPSKAKDGEEASSNATLIVSHVASEIDSIEIRWNSTSPTNGSASAFRIEALNLDNEILIISPQLSPEIDQFTIPNLAIDTKYLVCVKRLNDGETVCEKFQTIPLVRFDTYLAVLVTVAIIIVCVLIAVICRRCALRNAADDEDQLVESEVDENNKEGDDASPTGDEPAAPGDEKSPLLEQGATPAEPNKEQPDTLYLFLASPALEENK